MSRSILISVLLLSLAALVYAEGTRLTADEEIAAANRRGQVVFLLLTHGDVPGLASARELTQLAQSRVAGSAVVELDRSLAESAPAIAAFRLKSAPVPLVLVVAQNGVAVGAVRPGDKGAIERLVQLVPSPRKAEYFQLLAQKRVALVAFTRANMTERSGLFESLSVMSRTLKEQAGTVLVDLDDAAEARFMAEWKVPADAARPVLVVVNAKGQTLGRLEGAPTADEILALVNRKAPCCSDPGCNGCK